MKKLIKSVIIIMAITAAIIIMPAYAEIDFDNIPWWYPTSQEEIDNFEDFHGANLPRVQDDADIFNDAEEALLTETIYRIIEKSGFDFVVFTDTSSYGLNEDVYSADFYQFNGYGLGDDYSGTIFYIRLNYDSCWFTASRGRSRDVFTSTVTNEIDERLFDRMVDAKNGDSTFFAAVDYYLSMVESLFTIPEWYDNEVALKDKVDRGMTRVIDTQKRLIDDDYSAINRAIDKFIDKTGIDFVVLNDVKPFTVDAGMYARDFYEHNGFAKDGYILFMNNGDTVVQGFGKAEKLAERWNSELVDAYNEGGIDLLAKKCKTLTKFKFLPWKFSGFLFWAAISALFGLTRGKKHQNKDVRAMKIISQIGTAQYIKDGSLNIDNVRTTFLGTRVSKTPIVRSTGGSGGSGGGSSHHSFSSSGGGSFSGGGRHF